MSQMQTGSPGIGFIGVGAMGRPIALRLLRAGFPLVVCDTDQAALAAMREHGARVAATPAAVADQAELVFACLPAPHISEQVAFGATGVIHCSAIRLYAEMSTIGRKTMDLIAASLSARGIGVLDAPVSGGPRGEQAGQLTCFVSCEPGHYEQALPALRGMADNLFHVGHAPGQAQVLKLANNLLGAANLTLACEMVLMARRAGVDPKTAIDVINVSTGRNRATEVMFKDQILDNVFDRGARLNILQKDVDLAVAEAETLGVEHSAARAVRDIWDAAVEAGMGAEDLARIYCFIERQGERR